MKNVIKAIAGACLLTASGVSLAVPVTFDISGSGSDVSVLNQSNGFLCGITGCTIDAQLSSDLDSQSASLSAGDSWSFDFFDVSLSGFGDTSAELSATLAFDQPLGSPDVTSDANGNFFTFFGILSAGELVWDALAPIELADGTKFSVEFEDISDIVLFAPITVGATVTLINEAAAVVTTGPSVKISEPAVLALMGLGILGFSAARRRLRG